MSRLIALAFIVVGGSGAWFVGGDRFVVSAQQTKSSSAQPAKPKTASSTASNPSDLDRLVAPVALYPDTLLAQMLLCAGDPPQVTKLAKWLPVNQLTGTALQDAATVDGFDPSFVALALFPQVVKYMSDNLDWTTRLGKAFAANRSGVFDSIQRLRAQAQQAGNLVDTPQQDVETKTTSSGQQVIVIEPANPQVIYVPTYNPTVVYTQPAPTTVVVEQDDHTDAAVAGVIGFTAGIALGAAMDNDYYYGPYGWHGGAYMYNDAWNDYYDAREDAREDWMDHREDLVEERGDRAKNAQEQRTDRAETRTEQRTDRSQTRQETGTTQTRPQSTSAGSREARGYGDGGTQVNRDRTGTKSDAFSGYSSGSSTRAASSRGSASRGSTRSGGGGGGRRR